MVFDLYSKVSIEMKKFVNTYIAQFYLALSISLILLVSFIGLWIYIYVSLAENASYINAFLLLIPFDVLSENPYIKLYIKN
jgi:hypothetical protein